jgi:hypothetical protein
MDAATVRDLCRRVFCRWACGPDPANRPFLDEQFVSQFPEDVRDRVFLLGIQSEPEPLRKEYGDSLENIGKALATECYRNENQLWNHQLMAHNASERARLNAKVKGILFNVQ